MANSSRTFSIALGIHTSKCVVHVPFKRLANNVDVQNPIAVSAVQLEGWGVLIIIFVAGIFQGTQYHSRNKC